MCSITIPTGRKPSILRLFLALVSSLLLSCSGPAAEEPSPSGGNEDQLAREAVLAALLPNGLAETSRGSGLVSLYDNALAALLFIQEGDLPRAEAILDFFDSRIDTEMCVQGELMGFAQFRNAQGIPPEGEEKRWLGDNAWLLIAVNAYREKADPAGYEALRSVLEGWIRSLQDADGGLFGGTDPAGNVIGKVTEAMLDAYNAVGGDDGFHANLLDYLDAEVWVPATGLLRAGENLDPAYRYAYALDVCSWGYCAVPGFPASVLDAADRFLTAKANAEGRLVEGYCFDDDRDTVWYEGTAEMAVAFTTAGNGARAAEILGELAKGFLPSSADSPAGLPYASTPGTGFGGGALWQGADRITATVACVWYLFAYQGYDPMALGREGKAGALNRFLRL